MPDYFFKRRMVLKKFFFKFYKNNFEDTAPFSCHGNEIITVAVETYLDRDPVEVSRCASALLRPRRRSLLPPGEKRKYQFSFGQLEKSNTTNEFIYLILHIIVGSSDYPQETKQKQLTPPHDVRIQCCTFPMKKDRIRNELE